MNSRTRPLRNSLKVNHHGDGFVSVTVRLPESLLNAYAHFLEALSDFFFAADRQAHIDWLKSRREKDARYQLEAKQAREQFARLVLESFDRHNAPGLSRFELLKRIAADLRVIKHPWRKYEIIRKTLVEAGLGGRPGRPRREVRK
ncbi:hypothetical protein EDC39_101488 [Geothermobacter ehrlichii]|uniref:Uncharacterized protein n=1 Tax=Geothermobacter ehrlichii TaxID=213224 RepID=A0A5D3WP41_9BACT|nr:hypothetical protein [Geothermobacter ehrlichii]TYP00322.1 hypothetical protein EDC39_101488 [Geothermobacter ehrlichii]